MSFRKATLPEAVRFGFRGFLAWNGRATRADFWWWTLFSSVLISLPVVTSLVIMATQGTYIYQDEYGMPYTLPLLILPEPANTIVTFLETATGLACLAILLPTVSVLVRRLHDAGRSAWWFSSTLIAYLSAFLFLVVAVFTPVSLTDSELLFIAVNVAGPLAGALVGFILSVVLFVLLILPSTSRDTRWDGGYRPSRAAPASHR